MAKKFCKCDQVMMFPQISKSQKLILQSQLQIDLSQDRIYANLDPKSSHYLVFKFSRSTHISVPYILIKILFTRYQMLATRYWILVTRFFTRADTKLIDVVFWGINLKKVVIDYPVFKFARNKWILRWAAKPAFPSSSFMISDFVISRIVYKSII